VSPLVDQEVYAACARDLAWATLRLHVKPLYGARQRGVVSLVPLSGVGHRRRV
jgi:hypothetical protein